MYPNVKRYLCAVLASSTAFAVWAAEAPQVKNLQCQTMSCAPGRSTHTGAAGVTVGGNAADKAGGSLGVVILDASDKAVYRGHLPVRQDGTFRALVPISQLAPGQYKLGVITLEKPASIVGEGTFEVVMAEVVEQKGLRGFLDRLNANMEKQSAGDGAAAGASSAAASTASAPAAWGGGFFFRTFGLAIPGVAYTTDNYATNTRTTTVSAGYVTKSSIRINPDGTYIWNSAWDGKVIQGRWKQEGGAIIVLNGQSNLNWKMDRMSKPSGAAVVTLWDQHSIWYNGTPLD